MHSNTTETQDLASAPVIFMVDDEPMLLELVAAILLPLGVKTVGYRNAEDALHAFASAEAKPALVITDYAMGEGVMNGLELIQACRQIRPGQKTMLVSGTVDEQIYRNVPQKPDTFLAKPYNPPQFSRLVKALLKP